MLKGFALGLALAMLTMVPLYIINPPAGLLILSLLGTVGLMSYIIS